MFGQLAGRTWKGLPMTMQDVLFVRLKMASKHQEQKTCLFGD